ncbi:hypothetical protein EZS27_001384 [termite gut metagenome]|uniref:Uncharacterized protein n=1 Tax=termite gut metagenome TaxID=433724 RepID=A0A5J4SZ84_9ZZZZ
MDAEHWKDVNCHGCSIYECESVTEKEAACIAAFYVDVGFVTGEIPVSKVIDTIGIDKDSLCNTCKSKKQ